jgi:enoyl-CoA hydratase/carnithine racemase
VPVARNIGRKRLMELALTGDPIDARTAADWGLINYAVPDAELDAASTTPSRATRGSRFGKGGQADALRAARPPRGRRPAVAVEVMAGMSQSAGARRALWRRF